MPSQSLLSDGGWGGTGYLLPGAATATASSSNIGNPPSYLVDGDLTTVWRPQYVCAPSVSVNRYCCEPEWVQLTSTNSGAIGGLVIRGPRSSTMNGRVLTGRLEFYRVGSLIPLSSSDIVFSQFNADWAFQFPFAFGGAGSIRFRLGHSDVPLPAIAEIELYAP